MLFFLALLYYIVMGLFTLVLYFVVKKRESIVRPILFSCMILTGAGVMALVLTEHRLPLYGAFEATIYLIFVLTLMESIFRGEKELPTQMNTCGGTALISLCLLLCHCTQPKIFNPDFFMYGNPWTNLFFNLRLTAAALFTRGMLLYQIGLWTPPFNPKRTDGENSTMTQRRNILFSSARHMLLVGLVIFLCSEWSGSWWCLNWLGDSWRWSGGFFKAAIVFMLVMLTCHLPPALSKNPRIKAMTGSLPALFLLWTVFYH